MDVHPHPFLVVLRRDLLDHGVKGTQKSVAADHEVGFGGEGLEDSGEFDSDIASADEDDFCGLVLELEESVGSNAMFGAGDVFGDDGVASYNQIVSIEIHGTRQADNTHQWRPGFCRRRR